MLHKPVLTEELMAIIQPKSGGVYVDMTLGAAGHTSRILKLSSPKGIVIAFDKDEDAIKHATETLKPIYQDRLILVHEDFVKLDEVLESLGFEEVDGVVMDLGVSLDQLKSKKGFSFNIDAPLDMRMDKRSPLTASEIINSFREDELERILRVYGEERFAKRIAKQIVKHRPIHTTKQLAELIEDTVPRHFSRKIHPATRSFQALRIVVNDELESLQGGLKAAIKRLKIGGSICVISFHSLEDRIVKNTLRNFKQKGIVRPLTKKPIYPSKKEILKNRQARSAKMRCALKIAKEADND